MLGNMDHLDLGDNVDIDHFARIGPKSGVVLDPQDARDFLSHLGQVSDIQASAAGYNNRLYKVTVTTATDDAQESVVAVVKAGGRAWKRVKTEAEVAGLAIAGATAESSDAADPHHGDPIPIPQVLCWRSAGAQELVAIDHQPGVVLKALWPHLQAEHRMSAVTQLAHIVCRMKSSPAARGLVAQGAIGNFSVRHGPVARADGPPKLNDITLGRMVDGGLGPWFPTSAGGPPVLLRYVRDTTHAAVATLRSPALDVLAGMRTRLAPRIDAYIAALDSIGSPNATPSSLLPNDLATWAAVPLSLTHGDLNLQNVLVTIDGITDSLHPSPTDPFALDLDAAAPVLASLKSLDPATNKLRITSILDWEWAGVFPWTDEFRASFDFLATSEVESESLALRNEFYAILDASGMPTPSHTHQAEWTWLSGVSLVRDTLAPWWMRDLVDPGAEEHNESKRVCEDELDQALSAVGY